MPRKEILDQIQKYIHPFRISSGKGFQLKDFDPGDTRCLFNGPASVGRALSYHADRAPCAAA
ncbi:hypothetical protein FNJ47_47835 [Bradyrhizobium sp. UFLA 03-164]|uniref:Uncharacterized protein n=2 Tax=Bradyrhizobium uaiense TaxID=2594946 RepID=A0A6P1C0J4_9BRAD|nr:hypothetical protein [Bradyrhizobium uaiense]